MSDRRRTRAARRQLCPRDAQAQLARRSCPRVDARACDRRYATARRDTSVASALAPRVAARSRRACAPPRRASASSAGRAKTRRGALLLIARRDSGRTGDAFVDDALGCFEQGDAREQQSWLRAIALLPEARSGSCRSVIDACRTNILPLFEAVACENPYPARYFPERNFNQMVLKALFNGVALARIVGLAAGSIPSCRGWPPTTPPSGAPPAARCRPTSASPCTTPRTRSTR